MVYQLLLRQLNRERLSNQPAWDANPANTRVTRFIVVHRTRHSASETETKLGQNQNRSLRSCRVLIDSALPSFRNQRCFGRKARQTHVFSLLALSRFMIGHPNV